MQVLVASAAGNVAGQIGDLCESAFKRGRGSEGQRHDATGTRRLAGPHRFQFVRGARWCMQYLGCCDCQLAFLPNLASRRLFNTTLTELIAIAALAITGLNNPNAAAGIAITL